MTKTKSFPTKIRNNTKMSDFTTSVHIVLEVLTTAIRQQQVEKGIALKGGSKTSLFADDILSIKNPKDSTKKRENIRTRQ